MSSSRTNQPLAGVLPVFQTPFHDDESVDFDTLDHEIDWLLSRGCDGVVMAMVSEVLRLSETERREVAARVAKRVAGRGHVVISVGAESTRLAVQLAVQAESSGATALMAIPPVSIAVGEDELRKYFEAILRATSIPLVVQDASGYVGRPMSIAFQANLLNEYGDRVLFKPEATPIGPRLSQLRDATNGRAKIFEGTGGIALIDSHRRGIVGTMPGADLIDGIVAIWQALQCGDDQRAYRVALPLSMLVSLQNSLDAFLAIEKHLLVKQGIFKNAIVRGPRGFVLDDETRAEVDRLFALVQEAIRA